MTILFAEPLNRFANSTVYVIIMPQVQLRLPVEMIAGIDSWVVEGRFKSRSDAIKTIISLYEEREKTRKFFEFLNKRSDEARKYNGKLISLEEV